MLNSASRYELYKMRYFLVSYEEAKKIDLFTASMIE